jgi:hypothetical protein
MGVLLIFNANERAAQKLETNAPFEGAEDEEKVS